MSTKPKINVVVDTNIIHTGIGSRNLLPEKFKTAIDELANKAIITLHVPEMVLEEVLYRKIEALGAQYGLLMDTATSVKRLVSTDVKIRHKLATLVTRLKSQHFEDVKSGRIRLLKCKLHEKQWEEISLKAVRRKGLFEKEDKSAFRDSVICASALIFARRSKSGPVVFITADNRLRTYAEKFQDKRLFVLPSVEALNALIDHFSSENAKRLKSIRDQAGKLFNGYKPEAYIIKWQVHDKISDYLGEKNTYLKAAASIFTQHCLSLPTASLTAYPRIVYHATEIVDYSTRGECRFVSKISCEAYKEESRNLMTINLEKREMDIAVEWSARISGEIFSNEQFVNIRFEHEKKSKAAFPLEDDVFATWKSYFLNPSGSVLGTLSPVASSASAYFSPSGTISGLGSAPSSPYWSPEEFFRSMASVSNEPSQYAAYTSYHDPADPSGAGSTKTTLDD